MELKYQEKLLKEKRELLAKRRQEIEDYILIETEKIRANIRKN